MKLYEITARADQDYREFRYLNVNFQILRVGIKEWDVDQALLCTDPYTLRWVERHLFTAEEAADIKRNLERIGKFSEILIEEVPLPVEDFLMPADINGYERGQESLLLARDPEWDGPEIKAYFSVRPLEAVNPLVVLEPRLDQIEASLQELLQKSE